MDEQARVTFLTANYPNLRDLRLAPLWLFFMATPWDDEIPWDTSPRSGLLRQVVALAVFVAWYGLLNRYYDRHFGRIEKKCVRVRNLSLSRTAALLAAQCVCLVWILHLQSGEKILLLIPLFLVLRGFSPHNIGPRRLYYIAASIVLLAVLVPALISASPGHPFFYRFDLFFLAAIMLALGILDHVLLVRAFRPELRETYV